MVDDDADQGERRLTVLESLLPDDSFVLGVDEHTGLVIDLDSGACEVVGRGTVVAAGSVVTRDLPANVLAAGTPQ